jgi:hypothetical protein
MLADQYKDVSITFSSYVLKKMGIQQSLTSLKIDVYNLMCVPYQVSMDSVVLLLSLSTDEIVFFQRFKGCMAGFTIVFQQQKGNPLKLFARCSVTSIVPIKNRPNVALINLDFKPCPDDFTRIICDYLSSLERLKIEYEDYKGKSVNITPETAKSLGFNNFAIFTSKEGSYRFALFALATDSATMLFSAHTPDMAVGMECSAKLYFQKYQFSVPGKILSSQRQPTGVIKAKMSLEFSPELVELLSGFFGNSLLTTSA